MTSKQILDSALKLLPHERLILIEELLNSLDHPDTELDHAWIEEAERRLTACRIGSVNGIPAEDVLGDI